MGAPRVDLFIDFIDFGPCRKIIVFSMARWGVQKSIKSSLGAPKGWNSRSEYRPGRDPGGSSRARRPQGGLARAESRIKRNEETRNGKKDLTRSWPKGPAIFNFNDHLLIINEFLKFYHVFI